MRTEKEMKDVADLKKGQANNACIKSADVFGECSFPPNT
jgi:hypothetical protein